MDDPVSGHHSRRTMLGMTFLGGAGMALGALAASGVPEAKAEDAMSISFDVRRFGAVGDGEGDDTGAIQAALDSVAKAGCGRVHLPAGRYRVTRTLVVKSVDSLDITGDGRSTMLLHETPEHLLSWNATCRESTVCDLHIRAVGEKPADVAAIACAGGAERSLFRNLFFDGPMGSGIVTEGVCDTTTVEHCLMWGGVRGTGIRVARGSEVRIIGGRIIGEHRGVSGIGVELTGGNGGVHIVTTDLIGLETALQIGRPGSTSNREVFLTHATLDGCVHGLVQSDHAYTSIAGCWAASSDEEQILLDENAHGAILVVSGGTIFNGGAWKRGGAANGLVMRAGSLVLSGVTVRHNKGTGILIENDRVRDSTITGCRIADNAVGLVMRGSNCAVTGNVFTRNGSHLGGGGTPEGMTGNVFDTALPADA